jgi:hypothetical protein
MSMDHKSGWQVQSVDTFLRKTWSKEHRSNICKISQIVPLTDNEFFLYESDINKETYTKDNFTIK